MEIIFVRTPFYITINEANQLLTKVELYIYDGDQSTPADPVVILEKQIPDVVNRACTFNISNYIRDYIENIKTDDVVAEPELYKMWQKVIVKTYYKQLIEDEWTLIDTINYVAVNGYTNYMDGVNASVTTDLFYLTDANVKIKRGDNNQYFNILVDFDNAGGYDLVYRYRDLSNTIIEDVVVLSEGVGGDPTDVYMLKVPYRTADPDLADGNSVQVRLDTSGGTPAMPFVYFLNETECLYTPIKCTFINRYGGWQFMTFFKARTDTFDVTNKEYNLLPDALNYNVYRGQRQSFNFDMSQKVKVNTGWIEENYIELIKDLISSEKILLDDVPVTLVSKSIQKKTALRDRMINYEMDFQYSFNLINDN